MDTTLEQAHHWAKRFEDPSLSARAQATIEAGQTASLIPALAEILTGVTEWGHPYSPPSRRGAVIALRNMGAQAKPVLPLLVSLLRDEDGTIRGEAATTLGAVGREAQLATPRLVENLLTPAPRSPNEPFQAARSLGQIGGPDAVKGLIRALSNEFDAIHWHCRAQAAAALGELGAEARDAVPALRAKLRDPHPLLRERAAAALRRIDPVAAELAS